MYELSHDGVRFVAEEVLRHETGLNAVMVSAAHSDKKHSYLVAGQESYCQLYKVGSVIVYDDDDVNEIETVGGSGDENIRQRKNKSSNNNNKKSKSKKRLKFVIKAEDSVKTDFDGEEPLLRVIRICKDGHLMATGWFTYFLRYIWRISDKQTGFVF